MIIVDPSRPRADAGISAGVQARHWARLHKAQRDHHDAREPRPVRAGPGGVHADIVVLTSQRRRINELKQRLEKHKPNIKQEETEQ